MKQEILEKLAASLGVTVERLWGALIAQAPISAAVDFFVWLPLLLCANYWTYRAWKALIASKSDEGAPVVGLVLVSLLLVIFNCCWMDALPINIAAFANPDFWALKKLVAMVKS